MKNSLPSTGFLRLKQIIGDPKHGIPAIYPVSNSTWWAGVKSGKFPKPVKISTRCVAWRVSDVAALLDQPSEEV